MIRFVSPAGVDSKAPALMCAEEEGSYDAPFLTVQYGLSQLHPGDTLYLRGGVYTGVENTIDSERVTMPSGTSPTAACLIAGYPGEPVILKPPVGSHGIRLTTGAPAYWQFQDFTVDLALHAGGVPISSPNGIYLSGGAHHNRFHHLDLRNGLNFGVVFSENNGNAPFNEVTHCKVHHFGVPGGPATEGHGFYISTSDNLLEGNEVYDNEGYGMHFYDDAGEKIVSRNRLLSNVIHGNGTGGTAYGILVAWGADNEIALNTIYHNPGGISVYSNATNTRVHDNSITENTPGEGVFVQYATGTRIERNRLCRNTVPVADYGTGTVQEGNQVA